MPLLANPRHERFAQAVATGVKYSKAYVIAGYHDHPGSALRLFKNALVRARVEEISEKIIEKTADRACISRDWIMGKLHESATLSLAVDPKTRKPLETYNPQAANRALELLGREMGMFREKIDHTMQFKKPSEMSEEELIAWITYFDSAAGVAPGAEQPAIEASSEAVLDVIPQDQIDPQNDTPTGLDGSQP